MKWKNSYNYFVIAVLTLLIYGQSIGYKFNMDDELVTVGNKRVEKGFDGIKEILEGYYYEDDMGYKYGYRPVSQITFAIEYQLFGENPHFSHFVNVVLYILICSLIFYFLSTYIPFPSKWIPLLITLLFLVHPLHVEAVASIKNREELLAFLFPFLGLIISMKAIDSKRWYLFLLVALCNFLAIYSKQSALALVVSLPFLVVLLRQLNWWNLGLLILSYIPFVIISIKDSFVISKLIAIFLLVSISLIVINSYSLLRQKFLDKESRYFGVFILIAIVVASLFIAYQGGRWYILFMIVPLLFKNKILSDNYLKLSLLFPAYLFLIIEENYWMVILITLVIYQSNLFSFNRIKIKKEWLFITVYIIIGIWISYSKQKVDTRVILPILYTALHLLQLKNKKIINYILFGFLIIFSIDLFYTIQENNNVLYDVFNLLLIIFIIVNAFLKDTKASLSKVLYLKMITLILISFFLISYVDYSYPNRVFSEFRDYEIEEIINEEYIHQNTDYSSRVIDLTENPYYYYKNNTIQNGQSISSALFYLKKILVPYPLSSYYGYNIINPILSPLNQFFILFGLIVAGAFLTYFFRKEKIVLWSILLSAITLVSISNIFEVIPGIVADRLAFILVLPFSIILISLIFKILKSEKISLSLLGILILTFVLVSFFRVQKWETPYKLFSTDVKNFPQSAKLHSLMAHTIMKKETTKPSGINVENVKQAKTHLEQALKIYPDFFNSHYDLARVDEILKLDDEAIKHYNYVIEKDSTFYDVYLSLADLYLQQGNKIKAVTNIKKYIEYAGYNIDLYFNLSSLEYDLGNYNNVIDLNKEIIKNNPQVPEAYLNIAYAYGKLSNIEMLKKYLEIGEKLAPNHGDAKIIRQEFL
ncbi:MAG: hypothetical protein H6578_08605 [Chitinophagales bacterium]|nr:hypothetical protein [Chitinophagales bacterium]